MFTKSFRFEKVTKIPVEVTFDNKDNLFSDLPQLNEQQMRSSNRLRMPKEKSLELKLLKAQARMKELAEYEQQLQKKLADSKQGKFKFKVVPDNLPVPNANVEMAEQNPVIAPFENMIIQDADA